MQLCWRPRGSLLGDTPIQCIHPWFLPLSTMLALTWAFQVKVSSARSHCISRLHRHPLRYFKSNLRLREILSNNPADVRQVLTRVGQQLRDLKLHQIQQHRPLAAPPSWPIPASPFVSARRLSFSKDQVLYASSGAPILRGIFTLSS